MPMGTPYTDLGQEAKGRQGQSHAAVLQPDRLVTDRGTVVGLPGGISDGE